MVDRDIGAEDAQIILEATSGEELKTAHALHIYGRWDEAACLYDKILAKNGPQVDVLHMLGVMALQMGNPSRAIEIFGKALELYSGEAAFY